MQKKPNSVYLRKLFSVKVFTLKNSKTYEHIRIIICKNEMNNILTEAGRNYAFKQNMLAVFSVLFVALITYFIWGFEHAKSAVVGGFVAIIPNLVFAYKAFKYAGARSSKKVVESFFSGVKLKMVLTAFLFALAFKFLVLLPIPFFSMFCFVMALPLVTPFVIKQQR